MTADARQPATLVANARMYAVDAHVAAWWKHLFAWIASQANVELTTIDHPPPRPLPDLWRRNDLGCAFICGYPWSTWLEEATRPQLLAAPIPCAPRYGGRAVYCTDIVVRSDSKFQSIGDLRGTRFAYTAEHSQSGWQAPRAFFADRARHAGGRLFGDVVGPLQTPRAVAAAVIANRADAGPLDSWWHDLLRRHDAATAAQLRTIARTPMTPIPPLVTAATTPAPIRERMIAAFERVGSDATLAPLREALLISGFARVAAYHYLQLAHNAHQIDANGYARLQ
ncbi:MAG TPA: PhnD/SsuA/transferrin family substrate-binding protein [Casimicrobiaceae bacterium]|nr:PhnD/SsuA/transferrin family substrate-binding protein [Casimicrobiaceae bacterium]